MKLKSYIFQIALAAVGAGFLGSCEDMLEPTSDYVIYENGSHLTTPADTATSLIGIIYKLHFDHSSQCRFACVSQLRSDG